MSDSRTESVATQLSFALYGAANRMVRLHKPFLEPLGLTFPQYLVVLELLDVAPVPVGTLGHKLDMDTGTITPLLKRMDAAGLVSRTRDPSDERRVIVDLTPRGRDLENDVRDVTDKIRSVCGLTKDGLRGLREILEALAKPTS